MAARKFLATCAKDGRPLSPNASLLDALGKARAAIASVDTDALGGHHGNHPEDEGYSFRDALLAEIDAATANAKEPTR